MAERCRCPFGSPRGGRSPPPGPLRVRASGDPEPGLDAGGVVARDDIEETHAFQVDQAGDVARRVRRCRPRSSSRPCRARDEEAISSVQVFLSQSGSGHRQRRRPGAHGAPTGGHDPDHDRHPALRLRLCPTGRAGHDPSRRLYEQPELALLLRRAEHHQAVEPEQHLGTSPHLRRGLPSRRNSSPQDWRGPWPPSTRPMAERSAGQGPHFIEKSPISAREPAVAGARDGSDPPAR